MGEFKHVELRLIKPSFDSQLVEYILQFEGLRKRDSVEYPSDRSTNPHLFFQLKRIFHLIEASMSARIEGNNTTIAQYIENEFERVPSKEENFIEIKNMRDIMKYIDDNIHALKIDRAFISDIHKMAVRDLSPKNEGDKTPGIYREVEVGISKSKHVTPPPMLVGQYMDELIKFINGSTGARYDLLKIAIVHHRFLWIHPFTNGNGRTSRALTYALLQKYGFDIGEGRVEGRLLNPSAVFCNNREYYYENLSKADTGTDEGITDWCEYVTKGLIEDIEKINKLLDYKFLSEQIIYPAFEFAKERKWITDKEYKLLKKAIKEGGYFKAGDVGDAIGGHSQEISRQIRGLKEKEMIIPDSPRIYYVSFMNNYLIRGVIKYLGKEGFLPPENADIDI